MLPPYSLRGSTWGLLVLVLVLSLGIILVAVAQTQPGVADTYRAAVECPDSTSANCYQQSEGVIRSVKSTRPAVARRIVSSSTLGGRRSTPR